MQPDFEQARQAFVRMVDDLYGRQATGRVVLGLEVAPELLAAALESGARQQQEADITDVKLEFFPDAALFSCRVRVRGKAWPPRPPVDTTVEMAVRDITHSEAGESGSVMFRVEKPLHFSSKFADVVMGLLGKIARNLPVSIDALRHKDSLVTIDFAQFVKALRPELGAHARQVRLYGLQVTAGKARVDVGFVQ
jgi:hypothetical protein